MNNVLKSIFITLCIFTVLFSFAACDNGDDNTNPEQPPHTHVPTSPMIDNEKAATCTEKGSYDEYILCAECNEELSRVTKETEKTSHSFDSFGSCLICGITLLTDDSGLMYSFDSERDSFVVEGFAEGMEKEHLVIPSTFDGKKVDAINSDAFSSCEALKSIEIPSSVTYIEHGAFSNCSALKNVNLSDGLTKIGEGAFSGCTALTSITIPNSVTGIEGMAFYNCSALTDITIPSSVTYIEYSVFSGCSALKNVNLSDGLTKIGDGAFSGCTALTNIVIPNSVTCIGVIAFSGCSSLTDISIPFVGHSPESTDKESHFGYIFNCVPCLFNHEDAVHYNGEDYRYSIPSALKTVTITAGDHISLYAFKNCRNIENIYIPASVETIDSGAFSGCSSLKNVVFEEGIKLDSISSMTFYDCYSIESFEILPGITEVGNGAFANCSALTSITIPDSVTTIGASAFSGCVNLQNISIPSNVTSISYALFKGCTALTDITIPDSVTEMGEEVFCECSSLTSVTLPEGVTSIGAKMFYGCSSLTSVTVPEGVTSIGAKMFYGCSSLTSIVLPKGVTSMGTGILYGCDSIESLTVPFVETHTLNYIFSYDIPKNLKTVTITGGSSISSYAFAGFASITDIYLADSITSIDALAFSGCPVLENIVIAENNTVYKSVDGNVYTADGETLIKYATGKRNTSFTIPDQVTNIAEYAFQNCKHLTSIEMPDSVKTIGGHAFENCEYLIKVVLGSNVEGIGDKAFDNCNRLVYIVNLSDLNISKENPYNYGYITHNAIQISDNDNDDRTDILNIDDFYYLTTNSNTYYLIGYSGSETDIVLPDSVNGNPYLLCSYAFYNHTDITSITIPKQQSSHYNIGSNAFLGCSGLTSINISAEIDNVYIDDYAFKDCTGLTNVVLPECVTYIGFGVFDGCTSLTDVYYTGTEEQWAQISIQDENTPLTNANIHFNHIIND